MVWREKIQRFTSYLKDFDTPFEDSNQSIDYGVDLQRLFGHHVHCAPTAVLIG
jgi:hypothetical protein